MFTHSKSIVRVLRMLMHLCAGHVTFLPGEFHPSKFLSQSDLWRRADLRWALPQISSFILVLVKTVLVFFVLCARLSWRLSAIFYVRITYHNITPYRTVYIYDISWQ